MENTSTIDINNMMAGFIAKFKHPGLSRDSSKQVSEANRLRKELADDAHNALVSNINFDEIKNM